MEPVTIGLIICGFLGAAAVTGGIAIGATAAVGGGSDTIHAETVVERHGGIDLDLLKFEGALAGKITQALDIFIGPIVTWVGIYMIISILKASMKLKNMKGLKKLNFKTVRNRLSSSTKKRIRQLKKERDDLKEKEDFLRNELLSLQRERANTLESNIRLQSRNRMAESQAEELKSELASVQKVKGATIENNIRLQASHQRLAKSNADLLRKVEELSSRLSATLSETQDSKGTDIGESACGRSEELGQGTSLPGSDTNDKHTEEGTMGNTAAGNGDVCIPIDLIESETPTQSNREKVRHYLASMTKGEI